HLIHRWHPVLQAMAEMQAQALATDILADTMRDVLAESGIQSDDLVTYYYNPSGEIFAYSIDTVTIEKLAAMANTKMGEYLEEKKEFELDIPLGRITSNPLLAAMGPDIPIQVRVVGNPGVDYGRSFESVGINEINHRIWIEMELLIQVTTPLLTDVLEANMEFTLIDQTLSGKVPNTYLGLD
ncbi:MAG: sporulation protein YunB, partial [Firmicutes bacterium]|nr:sporulation protein YunB [Bacillota bacterium]